MSFTPLAPNFNIPAAWWKPGDTPSTGPYDDTSDVQLYNPPRLEFFVKDSNLSVFTPYQQIRVPLAFQTVQVPPYQGSIWEIKDQFGNAWYYLVAWWDFEHRGFPNEYIRMDVVQCNDDGTTPDHNR